MTQADKAKRFGALHVKGDPVILFNAWDAGSSDAVARAGAKAIATSSWAVAAAQGFPDGEDIPIDLVSAIVGRITTTVDLPVSVDFEGGYDDSDAALAANVTRLLDLGVVGINFEDRLVKGPGLYPIERQAARIAAIRAAASARGIDFFINARTDLFLGRGTDPAVDSDLALARAAAYAKAGASGFFIPGLTDAKLIGKISQGSSLPVNVMMMEGLPDLATLKTLGVARVSYGHLPYVTGLGAVTAAAKAIYG